MGRGVAGFHDTSLRNAYFAFKQVQTPDGKSDKDVVGLHQPPLCPECGSAKVWKDGLRYNGNAVIQRRTDKLSSAEYAMLRQKDRETWPQ
jgi:hypothetical protein